MTSFDIVLVPFPFADLSTSKKRPCLVLSQFKPKNLSPHLIVAMMTSNLEGLKFPADIELNLWADAGLPKPTLVRLSKIVTIDSKLVIKKLGRIHRDEQGLIKTEFKKLFGNFIQ